MGVTSLGLGIYTVVVMGVLGFMWYLRDKDTKVSQEAVTLDRKLASFAEREVLLRKVDERATEVVTHFDTRESVYKVGKILEQGALTPQTWSFDLGRRKQTITVIAPSTEAFRTYVDYLAANFKSVKIDGLTWDSAGSVWLGNISFWGITGEKS